MEMGKELDGREEWDYEHIGRSQCPIITIKSSSHIKGDDAPLPTSAFISFPKPVKVHASKIGTKSLHVD